MKDEIIILIRKWFRSKSGIDLIHDPSLISLVDEIEALRIHDVVQQSEQLCQYEPDDTTAMNCKHCGDPKWVHKCCSLA